MKIEQISGLTIIETEQGTAVGKVIGVLIDAAEKRLIGLAVSKGGVFAHTYYIPFGTIISVENDIVTIPSEASLVQRRNLPETGVMESLQGRKVLTEDGKDLGEVKSYEIDPKTGDIEHITFAVDKRVLGVLWHSTKESHDLPIEYVKTLGENIVVDKSVPETIGMRHAA